MSGQNGMGGGMPQNSFNSPGIQNMGLQNMGMNQRIGGMPMQAGSTMATPQQAQPMQPQMPQNPQAIPPAVNGGQQPVQMGMMPQGMVQNDQQAAMRMPRRFNQY